MPIEAKNPTDIAPDEATIGAAYLSQARQTLDHALLKIRHSVNQLSDEDLWWRQHPSHNSIQNIVLHLCGNVRQWIAHAVGGAPDHRDRPTEFSDRRSLPKSDLLRMLSEVVAEASASLAECDPRRLLEKIRVQGFDTTVLAAIFDSVSHFVGHTHQVVYITRLRVGDAYKFQWTPQTPEQGAESSTAGRL